MRGTEQRARIERFLGLAREFVRGAWRGVSGDLDKAASTAQRYCSAAVGLLAELGEGYRIFVALFLGRAANALRRTGADGLGVGSVIRRRDEARVARRRPIAGRGCGPLLGHSTRGPDRQRGSGGASRGHSGCAARVESGLFQNVMKVADIFDIGRRG